MNSYAKWCPDTRFVLTGFSQGGYVVHQSLVEIGNSSTLFRVAAVDTFGDAARLGSSSTNRLNASTRVNGSIVALGEAPATDLPGWVLSNARSWCFSGDIVCAYNPADLAGFIVGSTLHTEKYRTLLITKNAAAGAASAVLSGVRSD